MPELPTWTATLLFTDIVSETRAYRGARER
jgi:hypothetical protein